MLQLKRRRVAAGFSQMQLAKALGVKSTATVSMWESGQREPKASRLPEIARVLGCSIEDLFERP